MESFILYFLYQSTHKGVYIEEKNKRNKENELRQNSHVTLIRLAFNFSSFFSSLLHLAHIFEFISFHRVPERYSRRLKAKGIIITNSQTKKKK